MGFWSLPVAGSLVAAGGALLGGKADRDYGREQFDKNADLQREFAQQGIRWRVEDAKAAGLHPLAALGSMPASASPISLGDGGGSGIAAAGQEISRALMSQQTPEQKATVEAQLRALDATTEKDLAQAAYWRSQAQKIQQPGTGPGIAETSPVHTSKIEGVPLTYDHAKPKPDEFTSKLGSDPSLTAMEHATWTKRLTGKTTDGRPLYLAAPEGSSWTEMGDLPFAVKMQSYRRSAELSNMTLSEWLSHMTFGTDVDLFRRADRTIEKWIRSYPQGKRQGPVSGKVN